MNDTKKAFLSPNPLAASFKGMVTGAVNYNQSEVLLNIENNKNITEVTNNSDADIFLVSLNNEKVFKLKSAFLNVLNEAEDFSFIMMPESDKLEVENTISFIEKEGVGVLIEVPIIKGKKRYTVETLQDSIKPIVAYTGFVKYVENENYKYPVSIINDLPLFNNVVDRGDYYSLVLPTTNDGVRLSQHLANYKRVYGADLEPMLEDKHGYFEYSDQDFKFILRLVLQYHFNAKRIAEQFKLPSEAFIGHLVNRYRYKINSIDAMTYDDNRHDIKNINTFYSNDLCYNNHKSFYKKNS